jgi:CMP-N,N'-diacetyllegionaminic acid synthase
MRTLAIIPARAGSERLPGKNKAIIDGRPLIWWSIDAAQKSNYFDTIVVTTDDKDVAVIAARSGCKVIERPSELALADTASLPVVMHVLKQYPADAICLLQPTSPLREAGDIIDSLKLLIRSKGDAVVSVTVAPPEHIWEVSNDGRLRPKIINYFVGDKLKAAFSQFVIPNGAIFWATGEHLANGGDWFSGVTYAYEMPPERSIDIDTKADLDRAREMVKQRQAANDRARQANECR